MKQETLDKMVQLIGAASRDELMVLRRELHERNLQLRAQERRAAVRNISVGDRVRLVHIKPKYLEGTLATVEARQGSKFTVLLDPDCDPRALARFGRRPTAPATTLEKVE